MTLSDDRPFRERAACAMGELAMIAPDLKMDGRPMWESYLPEVDVVLKAALGDEAVRRMGEER